MLCCEPVEYVDSVFRERVLNAPEDIGNRLAAGPRDSAKALRQTWRVRSLATAAPFNEAVVHVFLAQALAANGGGPGKSGGG